MGRGTKTWRWRATTLSVGFCSLGALLLLGSEWLFPAPRYADAAALRRWLALRDVSRQPANIQLSLVDRIQSGVSPEELLPDAKRSSTMLTGYLLPQVQRNVTELKRIWFEARCVQYGRVPPEQRMEFLERQVEFLLAWISGLTVGGMSKDSGTGSGLFFDEVAEWTGQAMGEKRRELQRGIRDGVLCWLATSDVERLPAATRHQLTDRLADELSRADRSSEGLSDSGLPLSAEQASRLRRNAWLLVETWVRQRAREFAELPRDERDGYVDTRIDEVLRWNLARYLEPPSGNHADSATASSQGTELRRSSFTASRLDPGVVNHESVGTGRMSNNPMVQLSQVWHEVAQWTERAEPEMRAEMEQLLRHVQWRLVARTLPRLGRGMDQADSPSP